MFDARQYVFNEEIDAIDFASDPLALLLAREEDGETVLYHEQAADRDLH